MPTIEEIRQKYGITPKPSIASRDRLAAFKAKLPAPETPSEKTGFAGTKFLGGQIGKLMESGKILKTNEIGNALQKQLDERLASGKLTPERHKDLSKGLVVTKDQYNQIAPKYEDTNEMIRGGIKAGTDIASLAVGGGGGKAIVQQGLKGAIKQGAIQGVKFGTGAGAITGLGTGAGENMGVVDTVKQMGKEALVGGVVGGAVGATVPAIGAGVQKLKAMNAAKNNVDKIASQIVQGPGKSSDAMKAKKVLSSIDTSGVKTYQDLTDTLDGHVEGLSNKLDEILAIDKTARKLSSLSASTKVGEQTIKHNFVKDSLAQLKDLYAKTNNQVGIAKIVQLTKKAQKTGLTIQEINNLAKTHGMELNAFNASGEAASGLTKQAAENTRKGLKATARSLSGKNKAIYEQIDKSISDTIRVKNLTTKMVENVNKLQAKIQERGLMEKLGRGVMMAIDQMSGGALKGGAQYLLPRGQGLKTLNALDLEKMLQKNLSKLQKLTDTKISDAIFMKGIVNFLGKEI